MRSIFDTHKVLVSRTSDVRDLQLFFKDSSKPQLLEAFAEYLEEHFEPQERDDANNSVIFKQFMEETFYPDEISQEFEMGVYMDVENGFNPRENPNTVEWNIRVEEL